MDNAKSSRDGGEMAPRKSSSAATPEKNATSIPPTYFAFWSTSYPIFSHSRICAIVLFLLATGTIPFVQSTINPLLAAMSLFLLRVTFLFAAIVSFLHQTGALRRYVLKFAEKELSKATNGALITLSDGRVDLWRGKVIAQDLIIHNKDRNEWKWDSPCLARVGRIEATLNFASVIRIPKFGRLLDHTFFDVYTVLVEDVQVFVEKRKNVFNFHLLDASLDIPDHALIMEEYNTKKFGKNSSGIIEEGLSKSKSADRAEERGDLGAVREEGIPIREREDEANRIVEKLVGAVSKIGKAANTGGSKGLQSALLNQKDGLVKNLKQLHTQSSDVKDWKTKKEKAVSVMRELGKVVEKNVSDIKSQVAFLQKAPEKKEGWIRKPPDDIRVGSILLRQARIFSKDILVGKGGNGDDAANTTSAEAKEQSSRSQKGETENSTRSGWASIVIFELAITGAELCPPMSARNSTDGMPVVGISIDRLVDILLKRIMAEVAKSNTGRLVQTAFGDVLAFVGDSTIKG